MSAAATATPATGMRAALLAFSQPAAFSLFLLGFGCGLPFLLVGYTLSIWLRESGLELSSIGLLSYVSLFYVFKFLWAPLLDRWRAPLPMRGRRRPWLLLAQLLLAAALCGMAIVGPEGGLTLFVALAALVAFAGATQDTLVDAYRIEIAPIEAQAALAATYSFGYRLGLILGGAGALYFAEFGGWTLAYLVMAAAMLMPLAATVFSAEPVQPAISVERPGLAAAFVAPFRAFFSHSGLWLGLALLVFVGLFKLPDQMLGVVAGPFYIDTGYDKAQIATVSKVYGVWIGLAGAFLGGLAVAALGIRRCLLIGALAVALSNLAFLLMAQNPGALWAFTATISADNLSQGFAGTVLVAFMSGLTQRGYTATQYALLSSLANLPGKLIGGGSGFLVEAWSYSGFFIFSTLSVVPTLMLLAWLWTRPALASPGEANAPR